MLLRVDYDRVSVLEEVAGPVRTDGVSNQLSVLQVVPFRLSLVVRTSAVKRLRFPARLVGCLGVLPLQP